MPLSAKAEYACLAMLELAHHYSRGDLVQVRQISQQHDIPQAFLLQVMQQLKRCGLVISSRGSSGGYRVAMDPAGISLGDVIEAITGEEENAQPDSELSPCRLAIRQLCESAEAAKRSILQATAIDELCNCVASENELNWHI